MHNKGLSGTLPSFFKTCFKKNTNNEKFLRTVISHSHIHTLSLIYWFQVGLWQKGPSFACNSDTEQSSVRISHFPSLDYWVDRLSRAIDSPGTYLKGCPDTFISHHISGDLRHLLSMSRYLFRQCSFPCLNLCSPHSSWGYAVSAVVLELDEGSKTVGKNFKTTVLHSIIETIC